MSALTDPANRMLSSPLIQISHKHPADAHPIRHDFDREELLVDDYPVLLADKIIPFLSPVQREAILQTGQLPHEKTPIKHEDMTVENHTPLSQLPTVISETPNDHKTAQRSPNQPPYKPKPIHTALIPRDSSPSESGYFTHKDNDKSPSRAVNTKRRSSSTISIESQSAIKAVSRGTAQYAHVGGSRGISRANRGTRGIRGRPAGRTRPRLVIENQLQNGARPLVDFHREPRSVAACWSKPVLVLRHDLNTAALRDVFLWSLKCVEVGRIVSPTDGIGLVYHNISRVLNVKEVAGHLKMETFIKACNNWLESGQEDDAGDDDDKSDDDDDNDGEGSTLLSEGEEDFDGDGISVIAGNGFEGEQWDWFSRPVHETCMEKRVVESLSNTAS